MGTTTTRQTETAQHVLDDRKAAILEAIVSEYVATAQPVGSAHLVAVQHLGVSPATVRHEMAALEAEGYLTQPHTSAGRVPTDKAYRFFVDRMRSKQQLDPGQRSQVVAFFQKAHGEVERLLEETSRLLSRLTNLAAVVVGPDPDQATIRSAQLVQLSERVVLLVLVLSNGTLQKRTIEMPTEVDEATLSAASAILHQFMRGRRQAELREVPVVSHPGVAALVRASFASLRNGDEFHGPVFVQGASKVAEAFDEVGTVHAVLSILEQSYVIVALLRDLIDRGIRVAIGSEHGMPPLADCSVVVAPFRAAGDTVGTIGVVGPTRMDYPHALAAVAAVSESLGEHLAEV